MKRIIIYFIGLIILFVCFLDCQAKNNKLMEDYIKGRGFPLKKNEGNFRIKLLDPIVDLGEPFGVIISINKNDFYTDCSTVEYFFYDKDGRRYTYHMMGGGEFFLKETTMVNYEESVFKYYILNSKYASSPGLDIKPGEYEVFFVIRGCPSEVPPFAIISNKQKLAIKKSDFNYGTYKEFWTLIPVNIFKGGVNENAIIFNMKYNLDLFKKKYFINKKGLYSKYFRYFIAYNELLKNNNGDFYLKNIKELKKEFKNTIIYNDLENMELIAYKKASLKLKRINRILEKKIKEKPEIINGISNDSYCYYFLGKKYIKKKKIKRDKMFKKGKIEKDNSKIIYKRK